MSGTCARVADGRRAISHVAELPRRPLVKAGGDVAPSAAHAPAAERRVPPVVKFIVVSVTSLLIGTLLGVLQTFPGFSQWLRAAGAAGHLIDPLAHAHINLVGGVTMGLMGLFYYVLPRVLERPVYSATLADVSFWLSTIGVGVFFTSLVILGVIEGNMVHNGMTYPQALEAVGPMHHIMIVTGAVLMGFGYWSFIANVFLTVFTRRGAKQTCTA
jgi:cbb3-type cytochrome oxidase subunit 1